MALKAKYLKLLQYRIFANVGLLKKEDHATPSLILDTPTMSDTYMLEGNIPDNWWALPPLSDDKAISINYPDIRIVLPTGNWLVYFTTTFTSDIPTVSALRLKPVFVKWDLMDEGALTLLDSDYSIACFGRSCVDTVCTFRVNNTSSASISCFIAGKTISSNHPLYFSSKPKIWATQYKG